MGLDFKRSGVGYHKIWGLMAIVAVTAVVACHNDGVSVSTDTSKLIGADGKPIPACSAELRRKEQARIDVATRELESVGLRFAGRMDIGEDGQTISVQWDSDPLKKLDLKSPKISESLLAYHQLGTRIQSTYAYGCVDGNRKMKIEKNVSIPMSLRLSLCEKTLALLESKPNLEDLGKLQSSTQDSNLDIQVD
jgi:hypothetical protein